MFQRSKAGLNLLKRKAKVHQLFARGFLQMQKRVKPFVLDAFLTQEILGFKELTTRPSFNFATYPKHQKLQMPALSPTMKTGNIAKWLKKEGDKLIPGDVICEVETDKATVGFEFQEEAYLAKIILTEGSKDIQIGEIVAIVVDDQAKVKDFANYSLANESSPQTTAKAAPQQQATQSAPVQQTPPASSGKKYPRHEKLNMPALSPTMKQGNIVAWNKKVGDALLPGDVICEVETDKATVGFEVQEKGFLAQILVPAGSKDISIGTLVAVVVEDKNDVTAFADYKPGSESSASCTTEPQACAASAQQSVAQSQQQAAASSGERVFISPLAKRIATENNVAIDSLRGQGTGPEGRVLKSDVDRFVAQRASAPKETAAPKVTTAAATSAPTKPAAKTAAAPQTGSNPYEEIPVSNIRSVIASRLLESKTTIPHYYLTLSVTMDSLLKVREDLNKESKVKISVNDFIIKACSLALRDVPECNSHWLGKTIRKYTNADISVAVSTESGLITPIVFSANHKGLQEISSKVKELADKAKKNALQPQEFQGGTFTISNLGMFGIDSFAAVINPPQSAILAVGKTEKKIVPNEVDAQHPYKVIQSMTVTLSCDHRVVDGAVAAKWLQAFKEYIEKPYKMLL